MGKLKKITMMVLTMHFAVCLKAQDNCYRFKTSKELLQKMVTRQVSVSFQDFSLKCNVNEAIKNRVLYLLDWQWSQSEIDSNLNTINIDRYKQWFNYDDKVKVIQHGEDSLHDMAIDSANKLMRLDQIDQMKKNKYFYVSENLVLAAGYINLIEAIPILRRALLAPDHYNTKTVELALARMGNKLLQEKIIKSCIYKSVINGKQWVDYYRSNIARNLIFTSTQESIFKLNEWLDTSKIYNPLSEGDKYSKSAIVVIKDLKKIILNPSFQKAMVRFPNSIVGFQDNDFILFCKNWLITNRYNYQINKEYSPY
jgi:hypothetical protein